MSFVRDAMPYNTFEARREKSCTCTGLQVSARERRTQHMYILYLSEEKERGTENERKRIAGRIKHRDCSLGLCFNRGLIKICKAGIYT